MDLQAFLLGREAEIRLVFFIGIFAVMGLWEVAAPKRAMALPRVRRWPGNVALTVLDAFVVRIVFPGAAVGMALLAEERGWGLLRYVECPEPLAFLLSVLALDLAIYFQHVMFHAVPILWRLHRVHHADLDFDVSTGARFHPIEILLSMGLKGFVIAALGPPGVAMLAFEVLLNATAMFNHSNVAIPERRDRVLRRFVVTPDMHRVHHSIEEDEANSNFGFNLPFWDRLFGTYREAPRTAHEHMSIGIRGFREPAEVARLPGMLRLPFLGKPIDYVINRRRYG